ncbi:hypothetical protein HMPREF1991_02528 [Hoylesella loescheii DSM 19665 = JCM 12249 = ATCC 15930]|uniref:Uncharacterized protein n=1 Tax=Hoylesella loescheii DSM 19665 = JCM 12249 = ATCC 15930 TaxID=1122985 RepID=A0A069QHA4_HOYLO|nr:hypothetical protein HMPREF1991_02528 [Hoylesella loescheii DSM 19665 = JCM 12249 = ATCC 15930]
MFANLYFEPVRDNKLPLINNATQHAYCSLTSLQAFCSATTSKL